MFILLLAPHDNQILNSLSSAIVALRLTRISFLIWPALVSTFNVEIGITGAILTKLDGDSRGGAALSIKEVC
jgi:hypothetical protein